MTLATCAPLAVVFVQFATWLWNCIALFAASPCQPEEAVVAALDNVVLTLASALAMLFHDSLLSFAELAFASFTPALSWGEVMLLKLGVPADGAGRIGRSLAAVLA